MTNNNLLIYTIYHKPEFVEKYDLYNTNSLNKKLYYTYNNFDALLYKIENINDKQIMFNEFVCFYYVYANNIYTQYDYIGFEHYSRRFANIDMENILTELNDNNIIVGNIMKFPIKQQYIVSHNPQYSNNIYNITIDILNEMYGLDNKYVNYFEHENLIYTNETIILPQHKFKELFEFIWNIVVKIDKKLNGNYFDINTYCKLFNINDINNMSKTDTISIRLIGFMIERLISCWIYNNYDSNKIKHIQTINNL
jgi:hypothetical protein